MRKIDLQNVEALIRQGFGPLQEMIADYEAGTKGPGDWRQNEEIVNLFGYGTNLEAVIFYIEQNYEVKGKAGKAARKKVTNG